VRHHEGERHLAVRDQQIRQDLSEHDLPALERAHHQRLEGPPLPLPDDRHGHDRDRGLHEEGADEAGHDEERRLLIGVVPGADADVEAGLGIHPAPAQELDRSIESQSGRRVDGRHRDLGVGGVHDHLDCRRAAAPKPL
jgi:hypothetical protein